MQAVLNRLPSAPRNAADNRRLSNNASLRRQAARLLKKVAHDDVSPTDRAMASILAGQLDNRK